MEFIRSESRETTTWAFKVFRQNMNEINLFYWSLIPMTSNIYYQIRNLRGEISDINTVDFFHASGPDARRLPSNLDMWREEMKEFENWTRTNVLVTAISNFETYLSNVLRISFESDPSILIASTFGFSEKVDGLKYLKEGYFDRRFYNRIVAEKIELVTKGDWSKRSDNFYRLFPDAPDSLRDNVGKLNKIREIRNRAAHSFGRNIKNAMENRSLSSMESVRVSENSLKKRLYTINLLASQIDKYLLLEHVGSYELLYYFHNKYVKLKGVSGSDSQIVFEVKKDLTSTVGITSYGKEYVKSMIDYYFQL